MQLAHMLLEQLAKHMLVQLDAVMRTSLMSLLTTPILWQ